MKSSDHFRVPRPFCRLKTKSTLLGPHFATIVKFQWFQWHHHHWMEWLWWNHWVQWFFDGFGVRQPLLSMVFDGCLPLVRWWDSNIPSLGSIQKPLWGNKNPRSDICQRHRPPIPGRNLRIVAQWWTPCESHRLKLYFGIFRPSVV